MGGAVGNVLQGVSFHFGSDLRIFYDGTTLFELLNPFGLLCGLLSVAMLVMHGAGWLVLKTDGAVALRAKRYGSVAAFATLVLFAIGGIWLWLGIDGYRITGQVITDGPSNPLGKSVEQVSGAWFDNFAAHSWILTLLASTASILGIISSVGLSMFPVILPSSVDPGSSLTVWDASSSHLTLFIMLVVTVVFIPLIVIYTSWVYRVLWGKIDETEIREGSGHAY